VRSAWPLAAVGVALLLSGCGSSPVLLDESDFAGVDSATQNSDRALAPGWTWCDGLRSGIYVQGAVVSSSLVFGEQSRAGATIIDRSADGAMADYLLEQYAQEATLCAGSAAVQQGNSIEPLPGLDDGALGWTTRTSDGEWGEYALIPLDEWRLLAVGFQTFDDEPPVDLDELIEHAREGAEQFPAERG
jgi:hypothetical protein